MKYYDFNGIYNAAKKSDCWNIVIVGGKGNGKTYGALRKGIDIFLGLDDPKKKGYIIRYVRRLKESITITNLKNLFRPHEKYIESVTDGAWNKVIMQGRRFYLALYEGDKKIKQMKREFCVVNALTTWETDSGPDEGECSMCIFDEAVSRERELIGEFDSLMKWHANCLRNRFDHFSPLVLLGNTVTRDCTILQDFGIDLWSIKDSEKGYIQYVKNRKGKINCIFEWCAKAEIQEKSSGYYERFENEKTKMITEGAFQLGEYATLPYEIAERNEKIYEIFFFHPHFKLSFSIYTKKSGDIFGYIREITHFDEFHIIINPYAHIPYGNVQKTLTGRGKRIFEKLYKENLIFYENSQTGEKYRSFSMMAVGFQNCIPD